MIINSVVGNETRVYAYIQLTARRPFRRRRRRARPPAEDRADRPEGFAAALTPVIIRCRVYTRDSLQHIGVDVTARDGSWPFMCGERDIKCPRQSSSDLKTETSNKLSPIFPFARPETTLYALANRTRPPGKERLSSI